MSVKDAAFELHVGLSDVAELIVSGRLRARVRPGSPRPNVWTVDVCATDVSKCRRSGTVQPCPVVDPMFDEFHAQDVLRRRRARTGWPPPWEGMPSGTATGKASTRPSPRRMGVSEADRVREVRAVVAKLAGEGGWVSLAVVCRKLAKRAWAQDSSVPRRVVESLVDMAVLEERTIKPRVGRPSYQIRIVKEP